MKTIDRSVLINYSAEQMYSLVNDIESYPSFMKGCVDARVLRSEEGLIEARLTLCHANIRQSFATRNELCPPTSITMHLLEGPFQRFEGRWQFDSLAEDACKVSLHLDFAFNNPLLMLAVGKLFEHSITQQVDSLCRRADVLFGK